jgi:hypothetical protein
MSDPPGMLAGMTEHTVSLTELKPKIGNAILLATTRNCRFVVSRYGTPMGAVVGFKDLQRLKKLDEAEGKPGSAEAQPTEKERYEALVVSIVDRVLLGEEVNPTTPEEWEIYGDIKGEMFKAQRFPESRELIDELTEAAKQRRAARPAA